MSYATSAPLQAAIFARLSTDPGVQPLVGTAIHDAIPPGTPPGTFIVLGPEEVADRSDATAQGAEYRIKISVISNAAGFQIAKEVAGAVSDALLRSPVPLLSRGRIVGIWFQRAEASRMRSSGARRIDLTFRVLVED